jgi:hypothetical protein
MSDRVWYDPQEDAVWLDLANLSLTRELIDTMVANAIEVALSLGHKVYALVCWNNTTIKSDLVDYYGKESAKLLQYYLGFLRYEATNDYTNISIRTEALKHYTQQGQANLYKSKAEALQALHKLKQTKAGNIISVKSRISPTFSAQAAIAEELYYDAEDVSVHWDAATGCVIITWKKYSYGDVYRAGSSAGLELLKATQCGRILTDARHRGVTDKADQEWGLQVWVPQAYTAGLRKSAIIIPEKIVAQMSLRHLQRKTEEVYAIETSYFSDIVTAKAWLRSS